jgi:rfaE bifunctional protein kinase chain/domain
MKKARLLELLPKLAGKRVLVVGDVFLDEYISGRATRLSREAPIPVLEFTNKWHLPGGAANPSNNIVAFGSEAYQVGVIGQDEEGKMLVAKLEEAGIDTTGIVTDPSRPTTTKTRILAHGFLRFPQQLARIDRLDRRPLDEEVERKVIAVLTDLAKDSDAILISDYRTGLVTPAVVEACLRLAEKYHKLLTVDSQGSLYKYRRFDLIKCNHHEAGSVLGRLLRSEGDFKEALKRFLEELSARAVLITRGPEGMSLLGLDQPYVHIPAANISEVFDVTGAGDTVIAIATLALTAGGDLLSAAYLANYAAGLVVRKLGNATTNQEELAWAIKNW